MRLEWATLRKRSPVFNETSGVAILVVKTTPHAARGNNAQARGNLQMADVTQQRAYE
jgi:hypothetical protein